MIFFLFFSTLYVQIHPQLCLPKGLSFKTQWDSRQPKFHSFIVTREDGSRSYGSALVFYEEVTAKSILETMQTLFKMHQANTAVTFCLDSPDPVRKIMGDRREKQGSFDASRDKLYVSKCISVVTPLPFVRYVMFLFNFFLGCLGMYFQ